MSVAVPHIRIELGAKRRNLEKIKNVVSVAKREGAHVVLLPTLFTIGPVTEVEYRVRVGKRTMFESIPGTTTQQLSELASSLGITIVSGPLLERVGSRIFLTSFVIEPFRGVVAKVRKSVDRPTSPSSDSVVEILGMRFGIMIGDDVLLPEVSLYFLLSRVDAVVVFHDLCRRAEKQRIALYTRALECRTHVLGVGGIVAKSSNDLYEVPTTIIDGDGRIVEEARGLVERIMVVKIGRNSSAELDSYRMKFLKNVKKLITKTS